MAEDPVWPQARRLKGFWWRSVELRRQDRWCAAPWAQIEEQCAMLGKHGICKDLACCMYPLHPTPSCSNVRGAVDVELHLHPETEASSQFQQTSIHRRGRRQIEPCTPMHTQRVLRSKTGFGLVGSTCGASSHGNPAARARPLEGSCTLTSRLPPPSRSLSFLSSSPPSINTL